MVLEMYCSLPQGTERGRMLRFRQTPQCLLMGSQDGQASPAWPLGKHLMCVTTKLGSFAWRGHHLYKEGHCSCSRLSPVFLIGTGPGLHDQMVVKLIR